MRKDWAGDPPIELGTTAAEVNAFFASQPGGTVIVVGHVKDRQLALNYRDDSPKLPISDVEAAAEHNGVFLILVGCNTADSAAGFGFTRNIRTEQVQGFLRELPRTPSFKELFDAMAGIGPLLIDAPSTLAKVAAVVKDPVTGGELVRVEVPERHWQRPTSQTMSNAASSPPLRHAFHPPLPASGESSRAYAFVVPVLTALAWLFELGATRFTKEGWFLERRERTKWLVRLVCTQRGAKFIRWAGLVASLPIGLWFDFEFFLIPSASAGLVLLFLASEAGRDRIKGKKLQNG